MSTKMSQKLKVMVPAELSTPRIVDLQSKQAKFAAMVSPRPKKVAEVIKVRKTYHPKLFKKTINLNLRKFESSSQEKTTLEMLIPPPANHSNSSIELIVNSQNENKQKMGSSFQVKGKVITKNGRKKYLLEYPKKTAKRKFTSQNNDDTNQTIPIYKSKRTRLEMDGTEQIKLIPDANVETENVYKVVRNTQFKLFNSPLKPPSTPIKDIDRMSKNIESPRDFSAPMFISSPISIKQCFKETNHIKKVASSDQSYDIKINENEDPVPVSPSILDKSFNLCNADLSDDNLVLAQENRDAMEFNVTNEKMSSSSPSPTDNNPVIEQLKVISSEERFIIHPEQTDSLKDYGKTPIDLVSTSPTLLKATSSSKEKLASQTQENMDTREERREDDIMIQTELLSESSSTQSLGVNYLRPLKTVSSPEKILTCSQELENMEIENEIEKAPKIKIPKVLTKNKHRKPYTIKEDEMIVSYIRRNKINSKQIGIKIWKIIEEENVCPGRKWESMRERWNKRIKTNLGEFERESTFDEENDGGDESDGDEIKGFFKDLWVNTSSNQDINSSTSSKLLDVENNVSHSIAASEGIATGKKKTKATNIEDDDCDGQLTFVPKLEMTKSKVWRPYTVEEDKIILRYLKKKNIVGQEKGNKIWQVMEEKMVCTGRSWQSMRERWNKRLRFKSKDETILEEDGEDNVEETISLANGTFIDGNKVNAFYSIEEDKKILECLVEHQFLEFVGGTSVWKKMAEMKILDRTWQSMKERYRKVLSHSKMKSHSNMKLKYISDHQKLLSS